MNFYDSSLAARMFDLQHEGDPILEEELAFFLDEIAGADGPAVDLGCGSGRILIPALERGLPVEGCDGSLAFLRRLREKAAAAGVAPRVWVADLCDPGVGPDRYALAFAAFRTFDHLAEEGSRRSFLAAARDLLAPGGRLLLDVANPDPMALVGARGEKVLMRDDIVDPVSGLRVLWWGTSLFDPDRRLILQSSHYDFVDDEGRVVESYAFPFAMRWTPAEEMRRLAEEAGFEVADCWGGFAHEEFEVGVGDAVWDLRRR